MLRKVRINVSMKSGYGSDLPTLMREWPERTRAVRNQISYLAAKYVLQQLLERIPKKDEWRAYRMGLGLAKVVGADPINDVFAVRVDPRHRKVRKLDVPRTLVFVKPRRRLRRPKPEVELLEKHNPWTYETLPVTPSKADALVINRKTSRIRVERVARENRKILKGLRTELGKYGHRRVNKKKELKVSKRLKNVPDVVFAALRLEFGLGTDGARPHWRPAIQSLIRSGFREFKRTHKNLTYALIRSSFKDWKKWPPRVRHRVRMNEARLYRNFQKRLAIRV